MEWPLVERSTLVNRFRQTIADGDARSLLLIGAPGTGKSRLLRELLDECDRAGFAVETAAASRSAARIPLSPFAHLVPNGADTAVDRLRLLVSLRHALRVRARGRPIVVGVDDSEQLDPTSIALLDHLLRTRTVMCIASTGDCNALPDAIGELQKDGHLDTVQLAALSRAAVEELVAATLDGHISQPLHHELWRLSQGNPLFLRELLAAGLESGAVRQLDGVWHPASPLPRPERLADVVAQHIGSLAADEREVVSLLAVGEPLELDLLSAEVGAVERLEIRGVVRLNRDGQRHVVQLTHPLYGEVMRAAMPRTRFRRIAGELADRLLAAGTAHGDDTLRIATWLWDADRPVPAELAEPAAVQALVRSDLVLAERLARTAVGAGGGFTAHLALGEALSRQGRGEEAEVAFVTAQQHAPNQQDSTRCAVLRVRNTALVAGDPAAALALGQAVLSTMGEEEEQTELLAEVAFHASLLGDFRQAVRFSRQVLVRSDVQDRVELRSLLVCQTGLVWLGELEAAGGIHARAQPLAEALAEDEPLARHWIAAMETERLTYAGRFAEAEAGARDGYRHAVEAGAQPVLGAWAAELLPPLLFSGRLADALVAAREALAHLRGGDPVGVYPLAASTAAVIAAQAARLHDARDLLDEVDAPRRQHETRTGVFATWAQAWLQAASGDLAVGAAAAAKAGRRAIAADYVVWGCVMLYDAARLGAAHLITGDLTEAAADVDGDLVPAMAAHAAALSSGDPDRLNRVMVTFAHLGADLLAAEAAAALAQIHHHAGRRMAARRAATYSSLLHLRHSEAATPGLALHPSVRMPLTTRELEVCGAALAGATSRSIAQRSDVSVRTVENHLASVYRKLDLHGRDQLASCLTGER